jgi:hypothetical protein
LNIGLDDTAANGDIHLYQTIAGYTTAIADGSAWAPDGRSTDPLTVSDADSRTALLSSFDGLDPNGSWTLFVADVSSGEASAVASWGLIITSVPEPNVTGVFALGFAAWVAARRSRN